MLKRSLVYLVLFLFTITTISVTARAQDGNVGSPFDPEKLKSAEILKKCQDDGLDSEECTRGLDKAFNVLKPLLMQRLDNTYAKLEKMVARAKQSQDLTPEEIAALDQVLVDYKAILDEYRDDIEAAQSVSDLKLIAQEIAQKNDYKALISNIASVRRGSHRIAVRNIIANLEKHAAKIELHIEAAKAVGHDTTEVEALVASAEDKLAQVVTMLDTEESVLNLSPEQIKTRFSEMKELLREAHADLKEASKLLRALYQETPWKLEAQ